MAIHEAVLGYLEAGDHQLMRRIHRWTPPKWLRLWMIWATRAGDGWLWYAAGLLVLLAGGGQRYQALEAGTAAAMMAIALFEVLKRLTGRRRPREIEPHCWAALLPPDRFSFPSGHSMTACALAATLGLYYPPLFPLLAFCGLSVAASRILLGMHFLTDVLAGCVLGILLGCAAHALFN